MLLGVVGIRFGSSVCLVGKSTRDHRHSIFHRAHSMADCTPCAILLNDFRELAEIFEFDRLITRVCAGQIASAALQALVLIDQGNFKLGVVHLFDRRDEVEFRPNQVNYFRDLYLLTAGLSLQFREINWWKLPVPPSFNQLLLLGQEDVSLQAGFDIVKDG